MRRTPLLVGSFALIAALSAPRDAAACGGCFAGPSENTEVAGHRMIMSISTTQSTLYDQLSYAGSPSSFAWVLPIKGKVDVGLSSDLLFQVVDQTTTVVLQAPAPVCPAPPDGCATFASGATGDLGADAGAHGVTVTAQQTVGPYETVQLASTDPAALTKWLTDHGYAIPADLAPVIQAYVSDGFDFLAMKLVPGQGVDAMRPVRVTSPGAGVSLPLRMVAGGAGAHVPLKLFVVGEAAWEPANFPTFRVDTTQLVWDWGTQSTNYEALVDAAFAAGKGDAWLTESSVDVSPFSIENQVLARAANAQEGGYSADAGVAAANDDIATLFAGLSSSSVRITRLRANLPKAALAADLVLHAAPDQTALPTRLLVPNATGQGPCPDYSYCAGSGAGGGVSASGGSPAGASACAMDRRGAAGGAMLSAAVLALLTLRRGARRTRSRSTRDAH